MDISPFQVILFLLGFGSILFLSYITTRYVAGKSNKAMKGKHIYIEETISLGLDKRLHLVKAGTQHVLLAVTSKRIEFLTVVDLEAGGDEAEEGQQNRNLFDFRMLFDKYVNAYKGKRASSGKEDKNDSPDLTDTPDFRANLKKLRTIVQKADKQGGKDGVETTNEE